MPTELSSFSVNSGVFVSNSNSRPDVAEAVGEVQRQGGRDPDLDPRGEGQARLAAAEIVGQAQAAEKSRSRPGLAQEANPDRKPFIGKECGSMGASCRRAYVAGIGRQGSADPAGLIRAEAG
jgi:hypothetical protein